MIAGLPQMCADGLVSAVTAPVNLVFDGPGGGSWTIRPAVPGGLCPVVDGPDPAAAATVTSTVHDFVSWGTKRSKWTQSHVSVAGDADVAAAVLDAINVI